MEILGRDGAFYPTLPLTRQTRDALAKYCELRWPRGRRNAVEKEWNLTPEQARSVCEGTASATTIDRIWKHKNGGWAVAFPVLGAVIDQTADQFIEHQRRIHLEAASRLRGLGRDYRAGSGVPTDRRSGVGVPDNRVRADRRG